MSSRGDIQRQFSQLMGTINAQGLKLEDVLPAEMQNHFQDMVALREAQTYIKEVEAREKDLQDANTDLQAQLQAKQSEIDNLPDEFKALQIDLQQSQNRIDFHKGIAERESDRAAQYQSKFEKACRQQIDAAEDARKIQLLQCNLSEREDSMFKLLQENTNIRDVFEDKLDQALKLSDEKDVTIVILRNRVAQLEAEAVQERETADEVTDTCYSLIDSVGQESSTAAEVINAKSVQLFRERQSNDQFHSAIVAEMAPLNSFYHYAFAVLEVYQSTLENALTSKTTANGTMPQSLDDMLDSANDQLDFYKHLATDLRFHSQSQKDDSPRNQVLGQVGTMANMAANIYLGLDSLKQNISDLLAHLGGNTGSGYSVGERADKRLQAPYTFARASLSSRSSVSSFTNMVKRFSTTSG